MPINLGQGSNGTGQPGLGNKHGEIASPQGPCGYEATPNGGPSQKGGDQTGRWGEHPETSNIMMTVARDGLAASPTASGSIVTPMSTAKSEMPGLKGSDGTGPKGQGGISSPWSDTSYAGRDGSSTR